MSDLTLNHSELTRQIYEKQHSRISSDPHALNRATGLYKNNNFGLEEGWLEDKVVLDIGCGNIGALITRLLNLQVKKVHGVELGDDWIPQLTHSLKNQKADLNRVELTPGNHLDIPYDDETFDCVFSNGVLIHLETMDDIVKGFNEAARVCKKGGYFCASFGPCGGLIQGAIFPAIRDYYRKNADFRIFIDNINPAAINQSIDKVCNDATKHTGENFDLQFLTSLFGEDFCVFLQNYIQAPSWHSNECTPEFVESLFSKSNFHNLKRLHQYCKRTDIRKYFAPLHYDINYPLSKILYGEGYVQYIGQKNNL